MAATPYNSLGGFSAGLPAVLAISSSGNLVSNVNAPNGSVTAGTVYANEFFYSNGAAFIPPAAGSNTQIQFNNNGVLGASSNLIFDTVTGTFTTSNISITGITNLGNISNVKITGGVNGYFLQTDGAGNLSWAAGGGGGGNGTPGGTNTQVQFNDAGSFGGSANLTFNKTTGVLTVPTLSTSNSFTSTGNLVVNNSSATVNFANTANVSLGNISNLHILGGNTGYVLSTYGNADLYWAPAANGNPAGINGEIQYNDNGVFGSSPGLVFQEANTRLIANNIVATGSANLGNIGNITIYGGNAGQVLATDGTGNLYWAVGGGGGGGAAGGNTQVQYNIGGALTASPNFTFNPNTSTLNISNTVSAATFVGNATGLSNINGGNVTGTVASANNSSYAGLVTTAAQPNITSVGTLTSLSVAGNIITGNIAGGNLLSAAYLQGTITTGAQPNITSLGVLTSLSVSGTGTLGNIVTGNITANYIAGTLTTASQANITTVGTLSGLKSNGLVDFTGASNVALGNVGNINIPGGSNGYVLSTDGNGHLSWTSTGSGTAAGSNTQVQYNMDGGLGASAFFTYNDTTKTVQAAGTLIANVFQIGSGAYKFCTSSVYFATTSSTSSNQVLWSVPVSDVSAVDFVIISTDVAGATRQTSKISATTYNGQVAYNEYAGLQINGGVGSFAVNYFPGNVVSPPLMQLVVSPDSSALTNYKMMIVEYSV